LGKKKSNKIDKSPTGPDSELETPLDIMPKRDIGEEPN